MRFLASEISKDKYVNLMDQYYPTFQANKYKALARRILKKKFQEAKEVAIEEGINRFD